MLGGVVGEDGFFLQEIIELKTIEQKIAGRNIFMGLWINYFSQSLIANQKKYMYKKVLKSDCSTLIIDLNELSRCKTYGSLKNFVNEKTD